ncbi:hypothetical protein B0A55_10002 [Friedmanniomyces simplex]|uniref:Rhodanese domain-containing protein n=1 Tax=Friedmanniomyces simplex TaxID=329884 RepID=A0A4U0WWC3_9PEZI|nr:hypothetical protein B0A55_10002 [Friedmanniomyces simplex]
MTEHPAQPDIAQAPPHAKTNGIPEQPWYAAYPKAHSEPATISRQELLRLLKSDTGPGETFVLVDLRRTDYEGGTIMGSINLPAQSLHPTIPSLYSLFEAAGVNQVIWYCGSSRGRGNRAAAWFADYISEQNNTDMRSLVLADGIKGWAAEGGEFVQYMQEYDASKWE